MDLITETMTNGMILNYNNKWLSKEFTAGKIIHAIPMYHIIDKHMGGNDRAHISQPKVLKILSSIKPDVVGIEGFYGDVFSIETYIDQQRQRLKDLNLVSTSWKSYRKKLYADLNAGKLAPFEYVMNNKAVGLGIEHRYLLNKGSESHYTPNMPTKVRNKVIAIWSAPRTIHAIARCIEWLHNNGDNKVLALPYGANHIQEIKIMSSTWEINFHYHEEAIKL